MKIFLIIVTIFFSFTGFIGQSFGGFFSDSDGEIIYCNNDSDCGFDNGKDLVKYSGVFNIDGRDFSQYIQDIVVYLLTFVSIIAVIYIIYAGFNILTGAGDEEKLKKSKSIISYVVMGLLLMWLSWSIFRFVLDILEQGDGVTGQQVESQ